MPDLAFKKKNRPSLIAPNKVFKLMRRLKILHRAQSKRKGDNKYCQKAIN